MCRLLWWHILSDTWYLRDFQDHWIILLLAQHDFLSILTCYIIYLMWQCITDPMQVPGQQPFNVNIRLSLRTWNLKSTRWGQKCIDYLCCASVKSTILTLQSRHFVLIYDYAYIQHDFMELYTKQRISLYLGTCDNNASLNHWKKSF